MSIAMSRGLRQDIPWSWAVAVGVGLGQHQIKIRCRSRYVLYSLEVVIPMITVSLRICTQNPTRSNRSSFLLQEYIAYTRDMRMARTWWAILSQSWWYVPTVHWQMHHESGVRKWIDPDKAAKHSMSHIDFVCGERGWTIQLRVLTRLENSDNDREWDRLVHTWYDGCGKDKTDVLFS